MTEVPLPQLTMPVFDLAGPLPSGTTLLEASAGTGKTYTVAGLVARFVAEGRARLEDMLVVTFGRAASQEALRERVAETLVTAERALSDPRSADPDDTVTAIVLALPDRDVVRGRLRDALAAFDAATIATTHQFCQLVLRSLGVAGDTDPRAELVEDLTDLVEEVVDDLWLRDHADREPPLLTRAHAGEVGHRAVEDPGARLVATDLPPTTEAGARVAFALACRDEVERRKRHQGLLSYDDLLSRLADALADDSAPARLRMRQRWRVVLVDEFQDTDPVQWQVIDRAFTGVATVVLIGDPKQAIYAFRGGDVDAYLAAAATADHRATLGENHRSDPSLVRCLGTVLRHAQLGHPEIVVHDVEPARATDRLRGAPSNAPWRTRLVRRSPDSVTTSGELPIGQARRLVAADCAADIAELLTSGATWDGEPIRAGQVAVLVHTRSSGELVQRDAALGIHSVLAGGGDILRTEAAAAWVTLLEAMERPHRAARVRSAALTPFFGHDVAALDAQGDALTDPVADALRGWAVLLRTAGVAAVVEAADEGGMVARVLARQGGERLLTDLRHVGHLLHDLGVRDRLGLTALLAWLRTEREAQSPPTERTRRLDTDSAAVQVVTIHGSKGLQYPVVHLPFEFDAFDRKESVVLFHDESGRRCLDVSGAGPQWQSHVARARAEDAGERLRLLYVGLTRAQGQVVTWWAGTRNTPSSALQRILLGRRPGTREVPDRVPVRPDDWVAGVFGLLGELGGPTFDDRERAQAPPRAAAGEHPAYEVRSFERTINAEWRRTSYSGLIRVEDDRPAGVSTEPEVPAVVDEAAEPTTPDPLGRALLDDGTLPLEAAGPTPGMRSPMADLPAGAVLGSLVHAVLEHADPLAADRHAEFVDQVREHLTWWPVDVEADDLARALEPLHATPLGPLAGDRALADIPLTDRLRELDFEIPLAGGDARGSARTAREPRLRDLAPLLRAHLPVDDPLLPYAARLEDAPLGDQLLRGYLSGSVDAVLRIPDDTLSGGHRYLIVDYKTNLLGDGESPVTSADYDRAHLVDAMLHSHYPLQALLYAVVVHRFLRWRLPGYDPGSHLGGVLYLFVRGMCGPDTPRGDDGHPSGVLAWRPPAALVAALSDLLAGGAP